MAMYSGAYLTVCYKINILMYYSIMYCIMSYIILI